MAKAREITGLDCSADALEEAKKVLRVRFEEIASFRGAALEAENVKGVHDIRVAARRFRSALRYFSPLFDKKLFKPFKKDLKRAAKALGKVRDRDVAIAALVKLNGEAESKNVKSGIEKLVEDLRAMRQQMHSDSMDLLTADYFDKLEEQLDEALSLSNSPANTSFAEAGRGSINSSLEDFCDLSRHIYNPYDQEALHKLRISAKRLRYAIELFAPCWSEDIMPFAKELSGMQDFLGEVHDCEVWVEDLSRRLTEKEAGSDEYQAAVWLLSRFVKARAKNYCSALKLWNEWQTNNVVERLRTAVQ